MGASVGALVDFAVVGASVGALVVFSVVGETVAASAGVSVGASVRRCILRWNNRCNGCRGGNDWCRNCRWRIGRDGSKIIIVSCCGWTLLGILFLTRFSFSRIYSTTEACCGDGNLVDSCQGDKDHHRGNNGFIDIENHRMDYFLLFDREIMKRKS